MNILLAITSGVLGYLGIILLRVHKTRERRAAQALKDSIGGSYPSLTGHPLPQEGASSWVCALGGTHPPKEQRCEDNDGDTCPDVSNLA